MMNKSSSGNIRDAAKDHDKCRDFYEEVGNKFPESQIIYENYKGNTRYSVIIELLSKYAKQGKKLLDIGCNDGVYTFPYCLKGGKAHGMDVSQSLINKAIEEKIKNYPQLSQKISFEVGDITTYNSNEKFDIVLMSEVLEHLNSPERAIINIKRLLQYDGIFILTTPTPLFEDLQKFDLAYLRNILSYKLKEEQIINTTNSRLSKFGVANTLYKHDGYYPLGLQRYIENFGFRCVKLFTCTPYYRSENKTLFNRLLIFLTVSPKKKKIIQRIPIINLFGQTNVQIYRHKNARGENGK